MALTSNNVSYYCVHVTVQVKPGLEATFLEATLKNAHLSAQEPGIVRFDVLRGGGGDDDQEQHPSTTATTFLLVEVYTNADAAPAAHKETAHYLAWKDTVETMMAAPRTYQRYVSAFPTQANEWRAYPPTE